MTRQAGLEWHDIRFTATGQFNAALLSAQAKLDETRKAKEQAAEQIRRLFADDPKEGA